MANVTRILVLASSSHEGVYCEHAIIEVGPVRKKQILARRDVMKTVKELDGELRHLEYWDAGARFYENLDPESWLDAEGMAKLETDEYLVLPEEVEVPTREEIRTDVDTLVVHDDGFYWTAYDKYADSAQFSTRLMPYAVLGP